MDEQHPNEDLDTPHPKLKPSENKRRSWPGLLLGLVIGVGATLLGLALVGGPIALAHRRDLPFERVYGSFAVSLAARFHSGSQQNPVTQDSRAVQSGRSAYTGSCAICHGVDGKGSGILGKATYPNATDLTSENVAEKTDSQLYWIIANGLSFTGMPGFSSQYKSQDIWSMVSYIRTLQQQGPSAAAETVPTATSAQLAMADMSGTAAQRGAAIYFSLGCQTCHGPVGNAPGELALRRGGEEASSTIRNGRNGMPAYSTAVVSDAQLSDLQAYLATFSGNRGEGGRGEGGGDFRTQPPNNGTPSSP